MSGSLLSELLEGVVDEGVHDALGLSRNAEIRAHLLEHLEDVELVGLPALLRLLLLFVARGAVPREAERRRFSAGDFSALFSRGR
ncbi:hypothetical protein BHE74_00033833 [Ensete ventricosum]|nr:hypothetical protein BHE74_00033833 [Ensete ventricosum]